MGAHNISCTEVNIVDEHDAVGLEAPFVAPGAAVAALLPQRLQRCIAHLRQKLYAVLALGPGQSSCRFA
jgi:hypothetical protein